MKRLLILLVFVLFISPSHAVEFGEDATGDPNAIKIDGSSGFLFSDRIVFTAAHLFDGFSSTDTREKRIAYWENEGVVYSPGIGDRAGQKQFRVKKVLIAPNYRARVRNDQTRVNDFAILILQESIPINNKVVVASIDDINSFIKEKTQVTMVGYGIQNPSQRASSQFGNLNPRKLQSYLVSNEEVRNYYANNPDRAPANQTFLDYGIPNSRTSGSICDGDSGSGFFVEKGNTRYYLGAAGGLQWGVPNCQSDSLATFGVGGGMSGITATFKFLSLISEAEGIVSTDKKKEEDARLAIEAKAKAEAELKAKQEAEAKLKAEAEAKAKTEAELRAKIELEAKTDAETAAKAQQDAIARVASEALTLKAILCIKGKTVKKLSGVNPKCPMGYKQTKR